MRHTPKVDPYASMVQFMAYCGAAAKRSARPLFGYDLTLFRENFELWFSHEYQIWNEFTCRLLRDHNDFDPRRRSYQKVVPIRDPICRTFGRSKEHWLRLKAAIHFQLCNGCIIHVVYHDGTRPDFTHKMANIVPGEALIRARSLITESAGFPQTSHKPSELEEWSDFVSELATPISIANVEPLDQSRFRLFYTSATFSSNRQATRQMRDVWGRFLFRLQHGICPLCGPSTTYTFDELEVDHVWPLAEGGNNSLINLWLLCKDHNLREKHAAMSEPINPLLLVSPFFGTQANLNPELMWLFSPTLRVRAHAFPFVYVASKFPVIAE